MFYGIQEIADLLSSFHSRSLLTPPEANKLTLTLLECLTENYTDITTLRFLSRFLTKDAYRELTKERIITHTCGYPTCSKHSAKIKDRHYTNHLELPNTFTNSYCSRFHYQCSEFYLNQLSNEALFGRKDVMTLPYNDERSYESKMIMLEDIISNPNVVDSDKMDDMIRSMGDINIKDDKKVSPEDWMEMFEDIKIVENQNPKKEGDFEQTEDNKDSISGEGRENPRNINNPLNIEGYTTTIKN
ncbi:hypothetical protein LJB42_003162 [Komagataella kurtzmanii]|nr:hypothetical protein LJB42_003162 [Komagataella kurtzmanii]